MLIDEEELTARPKDMNSIPGYSGDKRVLANLINGNNNTVEGKQMWLIPFMKKKSHYIQIKFSRKQKLTGIYLHIPFY